MRVLVCGSRDFYDWRLLEHSLYEFYKQECDGDITGIIHGGAAGTDCLAGQYGIYEGIPVSVFPARWDLHGKSAGHIRNGEMLREGHPDHVLAFLSQNSKGTRNMISQAEKAGVPVKVVNINE